MYRNINGVAMEKVSGIRIFYISMWCYIRCTVPLGGGGIYKNSEHKLQYGNNMVLSPVDCNVNILYVLETCVFFWTEQDEVFLLISSPVSVLFIFNFFTKNLHIYRQSPQVHYCHQRPSAEV